MSIKFEDWTSKFHVHWLTLAKHVEALAQVPRASGGFLSGWSVQSNSGDYRDGWVDGSNFIREVNGKRVFDHVAAAEAGFHHKETHVKITDVCEWSLVSLIQQMEQLGLRPKRARLVQLRPGERGSWHVDGKAPVLRMHFVIETNDGCAFKCENQVRHMPLHTVLLVNVDEYHMVWNDGGTNRTHLVVDVTDTLQLSKVHQ